MQKEFLIWVIYEKSTHVVVKFRAYKSLGMQFHEKFFNLVKDLFKWNEDQSGSVSIPVGAETEGIIDVDCLRKKYSCRFQILRSKEYRYAVSRKVFFNVVEDLFKWNEG